MKIPFFDISRQYELIRDRVEKDVIDVMRSTQYVEGIVVREFESKVAKYLGVKHVITCGNGTDSLRISLKAAGVKPGDEVITTAFSFFATAEAVAQIGAVPVFADILYDTYNIDPISIIDHLSPKTKAIIPVHIFGMPAEMDEINKIAKDNNLVVIEDACQAIGAIYKEKKAGSLANLGCFSFYPTKNLGGFGDGGMITTDDDMLANICRAMKAHAAGKQAAVAYRYFTGKAAYDSEGNNTSCDHLYDPCKYYNYFVGDNSRLDSIQAAVLKLKLDYLDDFNKRRVQIAKRYEEEIKNKKIKVSQVEFSDRKSCFHQFAILADSKEGFIGYLNENGIGSGNFYPIPLHKQKAFLKEGYERLPVVEEICKKSVCLPIFPELTDDEVDYIIEIINKY